MKLKDLIENFRDDLLLDEDEPTNQIIKRINRAGEWLTDLDAFCIERRYSFPAVVNQSAYALPSDFYDIKKLYVDNDDQTRKTDIDEINSVRMNNEGINDVYIYGIWENKINIQGTPGSSAVSTTLYGDHTATATTITVVTPSDSLPNRGCIKIDSEKIYFEKATVSGANTILSVLTRGAEDTVAAAHSNAATVTVQNIEMWYWARFRRFLKAPETGRADIASSGSLLTAGRHYLLWTYYDNVRGLESYPHDLYSITSAAGEKIALTNLVDAADLETYQKRIYMTKAGTTQPYYLVTTLNAGTTSYTIDMADASLATAFSWDNVGGDNLPDEFRGAVEEKAKALYLRISKRYNEAEVCETLAAQKFIAARGLMRGRRTVAAMSRTPDLYF